MQAHRTIDMPEDLIDEINLEIPEISRDAIVHHARRAVIDFCERSHYWQEDIGPILVNENSTEYDLPVSRRVAVVALMAVGFTDTDGEQKQLVRCETDDVDYRYWQPTPFTISFYPHQDLIGKSVSVIAALKPEIYNDTFKFSELLIRDYRDGILAKAKANLYSMPRKAWSDPGLFQLNNSAFEVACGKALRSQARGYSRLPDRAVKKARVYY